MDEFESKTRTHLKLRDLPDQLVEKEMNGITGFEFFVNDIEAAFKLSQNRDETSFFNIIEALSQSNVQNERAIAHKMKMIKSK